MRMSNAAARSVMLARRIAELAVKGGWSKGRHVTEVELSNALGVSRTPVRKAIGVLAACGALTSRQHRGYLLAKDGRELANLYIEEALAVGETLYGMILRDRIADAIPIEVTHAMLAARYASSRPAIDNVLARLEANGLLTRGIGRAWRFVDTMNDAGSIIASYDLRAIVEPGGLRLGTFAADKAALATMRDRHREVIEVIRKRRRVISSSDSVLLERSRLVALDADFHNLLAQASGNPFIVATIREQIELRRLLEHGISEVPSHVAKWSGEHLVVIEALLRDDVALAGAALGQHIARAREDALRSLSCTK